MVNSNTVEVIENKIKKLIESSEIEYEEGFVDSVLFDLEYEYGFDISKEIPNSKIDEAINDWLEETLVH